MTSQVGVNHYYKNYDTKERFCSYWHQINEILLLCPERVLEIGIGNGFVSDYVRERGIDVMTLDIDRRLSPTTVGSILASPFSCETFQVVVCYELLEHLPYENFKEALSEIRRISKYHAILSLPDIDIVYPFHIQIPKIGKIKKLISIPQTKKRHNFDGQHYWEIGKASYPLKRVINDIIAVGFEIKRTYRVFECPYHRFFVLKKRN